MTYVKGRVCDPNAAQAVYDATLKIQEELEDLLSQAFKFAEMEKEVTNYRRNLAKLTDYGKAIPGTNPNLIAVIRAAQVSTSSVWRDSLYDNAGELQPYVLLATGLEALAKAYNTGYATSNTGTQFRIFP